MADTFISYARGDDERFVERLCRDLVREGISVWWDRGAMGSRGQPFLQEIRDAITSVQRLILVIGPSIERSAYVRSEWEFALENCKIVIPILRIGEDALARAAGSKLDYRLVPEQLSKFHVPDFRHTRPYEEALAELLRILRQPVQPLAELHGVDAIVPHFLPRPEALEQLNESVLANVLRPTVTMPERRTTALQGMGGVGKSVLAAAFARACATRRAFTDGVVWLRFGELPNVVRNLATVGQVLRDDPTEYLDLERGRTRLAKTLAEKCCLLVLDDLWTLECAEPFINALGPRCRALITTRDESLAVALGAKSHRLDVLSDAQGLTLLARWAGQLVEQLPKEACDLVDECGNLPLALASIGAMVRGKPMDRWADQLSKLRNGNLDRIRAQFPNYPYPNLMRAIGVSIEALHPERARTRYLDLAVFPDDSPIPEAALRAFWGPEGLDEVETRELIDLFADRSLARRDSAGNLMLHDLHLSYVRRQHDSLPALHLRLTRAYAARCPDGWSSGPNDGYFFEHLAHHLNEAGCNEELCKLLTVGPSWMQAKFFACHGDLAFAADLDLALATSAAHGPLMRLGLLAARRLVDRRAEIHSDINLQTLVHLDRLAEALSHARLRQVAAQRMSGLMAICSAMRTDASARAQLLDGALDNVADAEKLPYPARQALAGMAHALVKEGRIAQAKALIECARLENVVPEDLTNQIVRDLLYCRRRDEGGWDTVVPGASEYVPLNLDQRRAIERSARRDRTEVDAAIAAASGEHGPLLNLACERARGGDAEYAIRAARAVNDRRPTYDPDSVLELAAEEAAGAHHPDAAWVVAHAIGDVGGRRSALATCGAQLALWFPAWARECFEEALQERSWRFIFIVTDLGRARACWTPQFIERALASLASATAAPAPAPAGTNSNIVGVQNLLIGLIKNNWTSQVRTLVRTIRERGLLAGDFVQHAEHALRVGFVETALVLIDDVAKADEHSRLLGMAALDMLKINSGRALDIARQTRGTVRSDTLEALALALARLGDPRAGAVLDECIRERYASVEVIDPNFAIRAVAIALARLGEIDASVRILERIFDEGQRTNALGDVAGSFIERARFDDLLAVARGMSNALHRARAILLLAHATGRVDLFVEATATANLDAYPGGIAHSEWISTLCDMALERASRDPERARKLFAEAGRMSKVATVSAAFRPENEQAFVALAFARAGWFVEAAEAARELVHSFGSSLTSDTLGGISLMAASKRDWARARELAAEADEALNLAFSEAASVAMQLPPEEMWTRHRNRVEQAIAAHDSREEHTAPAETSIDPGTSQAAGLSDRFGWARETKGLENFLTELANRVPQFDGETAGLGVAALCEAIRIAGWVDPVWTSVSSEIEKANRIVDS